MSLISVGTQCPVCKVRRYNRIRRKGWMRKIPHTKYYQCQNCLTTFVSLNRRVSFLISRIRLH